MHHSSGGAYVAVVTVVAVEVVMGWGGESSVNGGDVDVDD